MKKQQILNSATALFMELGYGAVSMDMVVRESKVSKATLYAHFTSKAELFGSVLAYYIEQEQIIPPRMPEIIAKNSDELSLYLKEFLQAGFAYYRKESIVKLYRILISEINKFPEMFELFFGDRATHMTSGVNDYLTKYATAMNYSTDNCFTLACQILDLLRGATLWPKLVDNIYKEQHLLLDHKQTLNMLHKSSMLLIHNYLEGKENVLSR